MRWLLALSLIWTALNFVTAGWFGRWLAVAGVEPVTAITMMFAKAMGPLALLAFYLAAEATPAPIPHKGGTDD
jgi:hypothetical protein